MADVRLPPESSDWEAGPPPSDVLPADELVDVAGTRDIQQASPGTSVEPHTTPEHVIAEGAERVEGIEPISASAVEPNGSAVPDIAAEPPLAAAPPPAPIVSDAAPAGDAPILLLPPEAQLPLALSPVPQAPSEPAIETFVEAPPEPSDLPAGHAAPPAEFLMQVSPIFSALDAAEKAAAAVEADLPPVTEPSDYAIPLVPVDLAPVSEPSDHALPLGEAAEFFDQSSAAPAPKAAEAAGDDTAPPVAEPPGESTSSAPPQPDEPDEPAADFHDAAAKIAEEATATAAALESLKRLLDHKLPQFHAVPLATQPPLTEPPPLPMPPPRPPIPAYLPAAWPVEPPPMLALEPAAELAVRFPAPERRTWGVGGFLAGFALSWVIGAILYAYLAVMG